MLFFHSVHRMDFAQLTSNYLEECFNFLKFWPCYHTLLTVQGLSTCSENKMNNFLQSFSRVLNTTVGEWWTNLHSYHPAWQVSMVLPNLDHRKYYGHWVLSAWRTAKGLVQADSGLQEKNTLCALRTKKQLGRINAWLHSKSVGEKLWTTMECA